MKTSNSFRGHLDIRWKEKRRVSPLHTSVKNYHRLKGKGQLESIGYYQGIGKANTTEGKEVNQYLDEIKQALGDCYKDLLVKRQIITAELVRTAF